MKKYGIIYLIRNKVNGKMYIGQTIEEKGFNGRYSPSGKGIERVYKYHKYCKTNKPRSCNFHLLRAIEKYGFEAFEVDEEFDIAYNQEELNKLEYMYIKVYDCINNGYNNKEGGSHGKHTQETKNRISNTLSGQMSGEKHPMYGKHHSEETKQKIGNASKERWEDKDYRANHILKHKGLLSGEKHPMYGKRGKENPNYGRKASQETRNKISEARKGKYTGENNSFFGKHHAEEAKEKNRQAHLGKNTGADSPRSKKVICLDDGKVFDSMTECAKYYGIKHSSSISRVCTGKGNYAGGHRFMYYEEYLKQQNKDNNGVA